MAVFAKDLRKLRAQAGNPTYREMAKLALFSPSVLSSAASGARLPTLQVTLGFVAACGGDREVWRRRWMQVANVADPDSGPRGRHRNPPENHRRPYTDQEMPPPAELPLRPCRFIDRRAERDLLLRVPAMTPIVITGSLGSCESDFAMDYAHCIAGEMTDGQLYADLGPLTGTVSDVEYVLDGFLRSLNVSPSQLPDTVDQRAGLYRSILAESRLLVLLDNVRDEQQVRPLLAGSRHSVTVVVSRRPLLGLGAVRRIRLGPMPRAESIATITAALPERAAAEQGECDRIAELCCDLPLALDIVLRKLVERPDLPLRRATANLTEAGRALEWLVIGDVSMREELYSAYQGVSAEARDLLLRIARLPHHRVSNLPGDEECEFTEELVDAGLLRRGERPGLYRMERLVQAFATEMDGPDDHAMSPVRINLPV